MTMQRLIDRVTPFTAGLALALLLVALVVQPVQADTTLCTQCRLRYYHAMDSGMNGGDPWACNALPKPSYQRNKCRDDYVSHMCGDRYTGDPKYPCPGPDSGGELSDCSSEACNMYDEFVGNICDWKCWSKQCDTGDSEKRCYDAKKKCTPGESTTKCAECKCVLSGSGTW